MRILLLNQFYRPDPAATGQLLADLGTGLAAAGHEVHVVCSRRAYAGGSERLAAEELLDGVRVHRVGATGFGRAGTAGRIIDYASFYLLAARRLRALGQMDAIIALTTPPLIGLAARRLRRRGGARLVLWSMDVYPQIAAALGVIRRGGLIERAAAALSRRLYRACEAIVALSEPMRRRLIEGGADAAKVRVIENWVPGETVRPMAASTSRLRGSLGLGARTVFLYSGNVGLGHEFATLLGAARGLARRDDAAIVFVGGGKRLAEVQAGAAGMSGLFRFLPPRPLDELGDALAAGDVHLITIRAEAAGLIAPSKLYGALAAGRPVLFVGPAVCEVAALLRETGAGWVVAPGDIDGLRALMERLIAEPALREAAGRAAQRTYEERFGRARSVARFVELLRELSDGGGADGRV